MALNMASRNICHKELITDELLLPVTSSHYICSHDVCLYYSKVLYLPYYHQYTVLYSFMLNEINSQTFKEKMCVILLIWPKLSDSETLLITDFRGTPFLYGHSKSISYPLLDFLIKMNLSELEIYKVERRRLVTDKGTINIHESITAQTHDIFAAAW